MEGLLVTIDSPEGAGKTTLIRALKEHFKGKCFVYSREPGGTELAEKIRDLLLNNEMDPRTEAYLYAASRAEHVQKIIKPAIEEGKVVILDRFVYSSITMQGVGRGLGTVQVENLNKMAVDGLNIDLPIFLDVPPKVGLKRKPNTEINRFEKENIEFHNKIYNEYRFLASKGEMIRIDATRPAKEVADEVIELIESQLL